MFNTTSLNTAPAAGVSKYLSPGINEDVDILSITDGMNANDKPFITVLLSKGEEAEGRKFDLYMTPAAEATSLRKLVHLLEAKGASREAIDKAGEEATSLSAYASSLQRLSRTSTKLRVKLSGEEYTNNAGEKKVRSQIGLPTFAEPMSTSPSTLRYDENNSYDFKRLPAPDASPAAAAPADDNNKLPF